MGEDRLVSIDDLAESVKHMKLGKRDMELAKAALRAAIEYALSAVSLRAPTNKEE